MCLPWGGEDSPPEKMPKDQQKTGWVTLRPEENESSGPPHGACVHLQECQSVRTRVCCVTPEGLWLQHNNSPSPKPTCHQSLIRIGPLQH
mmetsp:Transcript_87937/g.146197  ORF Transcript_87937/g.146197 Transcript_87937/m.146197 type:complete len:90 (-) Transcript_87937:1617-1886(-)